MEFSTRCPLAAHSLQKSSHDLGLRGYSYAITGINLTNDLYQLTCNRTLDHYFLTFGCSLQASAALFCTMFVRFDELWREKNPASVMEFSSIHQAFIETCKIQANKQEIEWLKPIVDVKMFENSLERFHS